MSIIGEFVKSAKDFIVAGPKLNRSSRAEIRDAVGKLADQLDASVVMVQAYLQNSRTFSNDRDLVQHLRQARSKLLQTYHEFRICQGLYEIRDRFAQVFDPVRASVSVGHGRRIRSLIDSLTAGERGIIDDLKALFGRGRCGFIRFAPSSNRSHRLYLNDPS